MLGIPENPVKESLILDPVRRLCNLVDLAKPHGVSTAVPLPRFCSILNEMYDLACAYQKEGNIEKAFVLYLRFVGIVVEELPKHRDFVNFSAVKKDNYDRQTIRVMNTAELLKRRIKSMYEKQAADRRAKNASNEGVRESKNIRASTTIGNCSTVNSALVCDTQAYEPCQKLDASFLFHHIIIPDNLPSQFIELCDDFREDFSSKFGVLYGRLVRQSLIISQVAVIDSTAGSFDRLEKSVLEPDPDDKTVLNKLVMVGCICDTPAHPAIQYFLSQSLISELVCVICKPGNAQTFVLHFCNTAKHNTVLGDSDNSSPHDTGNHTITNNTEESSTTVADAYCRHTHITTLLTCTVLNKEPV